MPRISHRPKLSFTQKDLDYLTKLSRPRIARDYEYIRHGTLSLLAGIDLISGKIHHKVFDRHRSCEFIEFLKELKSTSFVIG